MFELEAERVAAGRPVGAAFAPLHGCSAELRREAGLGGASSAGALSLEEQVASGAITPARYHELLQAEGPAGGALVAAAVAPRLPPRPPSRPLPGAWVVGRRADIENRHEDDRKLLHSEKSLP